MPGCAIESMTTPSPAKSNSRSEYNLWELFDSKVKESQSTREAADATLQGRHYVEETILPKTLYFGGEGKRNTTHCILV